MEEEKQPVDIYRQQKDQKRELMNAEIAIQERQTQEIQSKVEKYKKKQNQVSVFPAQEAFQVALNPETKAYLVNEEFKKQQTELKKKQTSLTMSAGSLIQPIGEIIRSFEILESKVRELIESNLLRYDQRMFQGAFAILDGAINDFKKRPEVQKLLNDPLFTDEELEINNVISEFTHAIVLETNFDITNMEKEKKMVHEFEMKIKQWEQKKEQLKTQNEMLTSQNKLLRERYDEKVEERKRIAVRQQELAHLRKLNEEEANSKMGALLTEDEHRRTELQDKNKQKLEEVEQRQKNILRAFDDQLAKLISKYHIPDGDTTDLSAISIIYHLIFILDDSGSMSGQHWNDLEKAFHNFINTRKSKSPNDSVSVVLFNSNARLAYSCVPITTSFSLQFNGGGTDFTNAFQTCHKAYQLTKSNETPVIIFMTDGMASPQYACNILQNLYQSSVNQSNTLYTFCVGFGQYDQGTLEALAKAGNGGCTQRVLNSNTYNCIYGCLNAVQLGEAFNAISKSCNSLDNIKVLMEAIQQDRKRVAQQFADANLQIVEQKQREYDAQQRETTSYQKALQEKSKTAQELIRDQLRDANALFKELSQEIDKISELIKQNTIEIKNNEVDIKNIEASLSGSPEVNTFKFLKFKIENDLLRQQKAVNSAGEIGFDVLEQERKKRYYIDAQKLCSIPNQLMDTYILLQNMISVLDSRVKHIKTLFFDLSLNYIDKEAKKRTLLDEVAKKYKVTEVQDSSQKFKAIIQKLAELNNYSPAIIEFLQRKFMDLEDILGQHIFEITYVDQNTTNDDLNDIQKKKEIGEVNFIKGFKECQIVPFFDVVGGKLMEKLQHKEVELANVQRELILLDEYSLTHDDEKKGIIAKQSKIEEEIKLFRQMKDGDDPGSIQVKKTIDEAFSAFRQVRKTFLETLSIMDQDIPKDMIRESYLGIHSFVKKQLELAKQCMNEIKSSQKTNALVGILESEKLKQTLAIGQ